MSECLRWLVVRTIREVDMVAVTLFFPEEIVPEIVRYGVNAGFDISKPASDEFRISQFFAGFISGAIAVGMQREDLAQVFKEMNYRASDRPEG